MDRRGFLQLLGLTSLAGLTAPMLEALGDAQGIPVPGAVLDTLPRPLVIPVGAWNPGLRLDAIDATNAIMRKEMLPALIDELFRSSPMLDYLRRSKQPTYPYLLRRF